MKTILVLGGFGFLGANLVKKLIELEYNVIVVVKRTTNPFRLEDKILSKLKVLYVEELNIESLFNKNDIHTVINTIVLYDNVSVSKVFETNFILPLRLIEYGKKNGTTNYITFDSFYRKYPNYNRKKSYIFSKKYLSEQLQQTDDCRVFNLQIEHMYGPLDGERKFVSLIATKLSENVPSIALTIGSQKRDFIYVGDVLDLLLELIEYSDKVNFGYYHFEVGSGVNISIKDFVLKMKVIFNNHITELAFGKIPENPFEIQESKADLDMLPKWLTWQAKTNLDKGIKEIFKNIKYKS